MSRVFVYLIFMNIVSCFIFRAFIHRGRMCIMDFCPERPPKTVSILIAGMKSQPYEAFHLLPAVRSEQMVYANYSCFGWNAKNSAEQINNLTFWDFSLVRAFTISVGDKVGRRLTRCSRIYSINPCPSPFVLKDRLQKRLPLLAILLEVLTFLLGWLAVLPLVHTDGVPYSLALLSDQLFEASVKRDTSSENRGITSIVFSVDDEFLELEKLHRFYKMDLPVKVIESTHGRTADPDEAPEYDEALKCLMKGN